MILRQIKYFHAVVEQGSFTAAAKHVYVSQSAVSQQIGQLENELGFKLLEREPRGSSLTPAGKYFYEHTLDLTAE